MDIIYKLYVDSGFKAFTWGNALMFLVGGLLIYLAIKKDFEPLLLIPIGFGAIISNLPQAGLSTGVIPEISALYELTPTDKIYSVFDKLNGIMDIIYIGGIKSGLMPPIIFLGVGVLTDFRPLLARPITFLLGAAAQFGIFIAALAAFHFFGFTAKEAASIGIIGGADGPTSIYLTSKLAPHLLGAIAVAAYSYMALVPVIQPPIMKLLTTSKERSIDMPQAREVSQLAVIMFPIISGIVGTLIVPSAGPLLAMLMFGNLLRECGVTERLSKTAGTVLIDIVTIFLGLTVGATMGADNFLTKQTISILLLGAVAFAFATGGGVLFAKLLNLFLPESKKINPCIGAAGVSAVPMAARVVQNVVSKHTRGRVNPLMAAMGPNVAGVIGSAVAAGAFLALFGG